MLVQLQVRQMREQLQLKKNKMISDLRVLRAEFKLDKEKASKEMFEQLKKKYNQSNVSNLSQS